MMKKSVLMSLALVGLLCGTVLAQNHGEKLQGANGHPLGCTPSQAESTEISDVFQQLNQYRQAQGRSALAYDNALQDAAEGHCHHMQMHPFFAHNAPEADMDTPWKRAQANGTTASGENIARGQPDAAGVMSAWKNSPGHNANMLNSNFTRVGIGYYASGKYWCQLFGSGSPTAPGNPGGGGGGGVPPGGGTPPAGGGTPPPADPGNGGTPTTSPTPVGSGGLDPNRYAPADNQNSSSTRVPQPKPPKIVPPGLLGGSK